MYRRKAGKRGVLFERKKKTWFKTFAPIDRHCILLLILSEFERVN